MAFGVLLSSLNAVKAETDMQLQEKALKARELGQQAYTTIFTPAELASASSQLPLELVADDSVHDYEKTHQPAENWPPTSWYANWTTGLDVFDLPVEECPIEMRWLVYRKN
jgi:hypothetical protein